MKVLTKYSALRSLAWDTVTGKNNQVVLTRNGVESLIEKSFGTSSSGKELDEIFDKLLGGGFTHIPYHRLATQGYIRNHVAHHIIFDIAKKCSHVRMFSDDPIVQSLLEKPSMNLSQSRWVCQMIINKLIDGNAYAEMVPVKGFIKFMEILRPDKVDPIVTSVNGISDSLSGYRIIQGRIKEIKLDPVGRSLSLTDMFHTKYYHPLREHVGLSKLIPIFDSIRQNNEISDIHRKILDRDGAAKGFIALDKSTDDMEPDPDQDEVDEMSDKVNEKLGPKNRGRWAVFGRALKFVRMGLTGRELDWNKTKIQSAREIALGLNYPAHLLGFAEGATFNNVGAALRELWTGNIIPEMRQLADDLEVALMKHTGREVKIKLDVAEILAIQEIIREKRKAAREDYTASVITDKEVRKEGDWPEEPDGTFLISNSVTPVASLTDDTSGEI